MDTLFILYVADQAASKAFYQDVLEMPPVLDVPGMTEFQLSPHAKLGLMPETGIARIICPALPPPASGTGIPRAELYLYVPDPVRSFQLAIEKGAKHIDDVKRRDWGDEAGYVADADGHVVAFARKLAN